MLILRVDRNLMILKFLRVTMGDVRIGLALEISRYESKIDTRKGRRMMLVLVSLAACGSYHCKSMMAGVLGGR